MNRPRIGALLVATALTALAALAIPEVGAAAADRLAICGLHAVAADSRARRGYRPRRGMFLLASPRLSDPRFARTVILLLEYDETGALGLVVNRPTELALSDALADPLPGAEGHVVFFGGPVEHRRLIALLRSPEAVGDAQHVVGDVYASGSLDTLRRMLEREGHAADMHAYLGYAGWSPGQLDAEIARGDWVVTPADAGSIFDTPPHRVWHDLMRRNAGRWVRRENAAKPGSTVKSDAARDVQADRVARCPAPCDDPRPARGDGSRACAHDQEQGRGRLRVQRSVREARADGVVTDGLAA